MADKVCLGWQVIFHEVLMNFLAWNPGRPVVSRMHGYRSNLTFSALLAMCPGRLLDAAMRAGLLDNGETLATSRYVVVPL